MNYLPKTLSTLTQYNAAICSKEHRSEGSWPLSNLPRKVMGSCHNLNLTLLDRARALVYYDLDTGLRMRRLT